MLRGNMRQGEAPYLLSTVRRRAGLTLGEMLIVLVVFLILTLLFVATSQQVMVKTRAARVASDQRMLSEQVALYFTYTQRIPSDNQGLNKALNPIRPGEMVPPNDPFSKNPQLNEQYAYFSEISPNHRWIIISRGPDGVLDLAPIIEARKSTGGNLSSSVSSRPLTVQEADEFIIRHSYDPTNGIISAGDIMRVERGQ